MDGQTDIQMDRQQNKYMCIFILLFITELFV